MKFQFKKLSPEEEVEIERERQVIFNKLNNVPNEGAEVEYLGKKFKVLRGVFWPHEDSKEIVKNMVINPGDVVLDLFSGSGVVAIYAALAGAKKVLAVDINPDAVKNIKLNAEKFNVSDIVKARLSDVFSSVKPNEVFDVITGNPPFCDKPFSGVFSQFIEQTIKDPRLEVQEKIFADLAKHLKPNGRVYFSQANFGNVEEMLKLAEESGFSYKLLGTHNPLNDIRIFYAFEFKKV